MPHDAGAVAPILAALGLEAAEVSALGQGFASDAWLVRHDGHAFALRIERPDAGFPDSYRSEHAVMARLTELGASVPAPIAGHWSRGSWDGPAFSLTTHLPGAAARHDALHGLAGDIAGFLRLLHATSPAGFGPLLDQADGPTGRAVDMTAGLLARFGPDLWPLGGRDLAAHPALRDRPALRTAIGRHADLVRLAAAAGPNVLVHSDLHEENLLVAGDRVGFIDFGETFVGAAAWEFAALAYFMSWEVADATLAAYLDDHRQLARWRAAATVLAIPFGLCRWQQDLEMRLDTDPDNEAFLRQTLGRIEAATIGPMEIMGVQIRTIVHDNVARRCDGCLDVIDGTPWRVNLLDIVASESPVAWTDRPAVNPGPFQFHGDPACVRRWMAAKGHLFCRRGEVREIMRPVAIPGEGVRWGLCDGIHRDDHEFVPA